MSKQSYGGRNNCRHHHPKWQLPFLPWNWTELSFLPAVSTQGPGTGWIMEPKKTSATEMALSDTHKGEKGGESIFTAILALFSQGSWVFCVFPHIVLTLSFSHMNLNSWFFLAVLLCWWGDVFFLCFSVFSISSCVFSLWEVKTAP